jgi:rSAM/selenodomain-associated transferase 2
VSAPVSVIIAALNEEQRIGDSVDAAFAAGAAEVIVCDGRSADATARIAEEHGARVLVCEPLRSRQLNCGAEAARNEYLIFVHADTTLPEGAAEAVTRTLSNGVIFGGFRLQFAEPEARLRVAETMINLRTSLTACPWGDQGQFVRRDVFLRNGGFREIPLMEDYELAIRMKRIGRTKLLAKRVVTSGRRFLHKGVLRTAAINWRIILAYRFGASPEKLAKWYRK